MEKLIGTVKWFNHIKGFGFIVNESGEDVFVHHHSIEGEGFKTLSVGQQVSYTQVRGEKGWQATDVSSVDSTD